MCLHPIRIYLLERGEDDAVQFDCKACSLRICLPSTINPKNWTLSDVYPCMCTKYGLPTFEKTEEPPDIERDGVDVVSRVRLVCLRCSVTSISLPLPTIEANHLPYKHLLTTGQWGNKFARKIVSSLSQLFPSDHVVFERTCYEHHAMVALFPADGKFTVIHYVPIPMNDNAARPSKASSNPLFSKKEFEARMDEYSFAEYKNKLWKIEYLPNDMNDPMTSVERAMSAQGSVYYRLLHNNCEHFVHRIKTDVSISKQVKSKLPWLH